MRMCKDVIDYLNISYIEALELDSDVFLLAYKCAVIDKLQQTEEGREYLELCERLNTTEIDIEGFRALQEVNS